MTETRAAARPASAVDTGLSHLLGVFGQTPDAGGLSPGDRAELRRMDPLGDALPPALWRLLTEPAVVDAIGALETGNRRAAEQAVAIVVQAMAEAVGPGGVRIGRGLAGDDPNRKEYAEDRFVQLLRARGLQDVAFRVRQAVQWCAAKGVAVRFIDDRGANGFARFVLAAALRHDREAERRSHEIARDYFTPPAAPAPLSPDQDV